MDHQNASETQANSIVDRHSRRAAYIGAAIVVAAGLAVGGAHFDFTHSDAGEVQQAQQAPKVTVERPTRKKLIEWDEYTGRFRAVDSVEVRARVSGYLQEIDFRDGQLVKQGDLLFKIDPRPFQAELDAAKADVRSSESAVANAQKEYRRGQELVRRGAISKSTQDNRLAALQEAQAGLEAARAHVETARLNLEFSEVRAPVSGRISDNYISRGNLINGGAQGGTLLTTIVSTNPIYFEFNMSEADHLKYLRLHQQGDKSVTDGGDTKVSLRLQDESGFVHDGKISFVNNQIDPSTGTLRARATFDNADGTFAPGMFARIKVPGSAEYNALLIPDSAVQTDQTDKFVWVVDKNDVVKRREVTLGPKDNEKRIVRTGLAPDDEVVVKGTQFVSADMTVEPQPTRTAQLEQAAR